MLSEAGNPALSSLTAVLAATTQLGEADRADQVKAREGEGPPDCDGRLKHRSGGRSAPCRPQWARKRRQARCPGSPSRNWRLVL
jgi:hypothetical protein